MKKIVTYLLLLKASLCIAQKEANVWYFGNGAGIDFSGGNPIALTNGALYTNEGCATVSDKNGRLLFYTDGVTVWDRNHNPMPNGFDLNGHRSTTQTLVVKQPGSDFNYFIFTADEKAGSKGLCYSLVDLRKNNGFGDVFEKNKMLLENCSEKITAIKHANGKDIWVLVHGWNVDNFASYLISSSGIDNMVISKVGSFHKDHGNGSNVEAIGYMKASFDGSRIALAIERAPQDNIEIFDFDKSNGKLSNPISINPDNKYAYGVSFSPDGSKLYVSFESVAGGVIQYDLTKVQQSGAKKIITMGKAISKNPSKRYGALQIGPDGKIYVATVGTFLDVINDPNAEAVSCGYKENAIDLKGRYCAFGLPQFIESDLVFSSNNFSTTPNNMVKKKSCKDLLAFDIGKDTTVCGVDLKLNVEIPGAKYLWNTGATTSSINVSNTGIYKVTVSLDDCKATDSINLGYIGKETYFGAVKQFILNNGSMNSRFDYVINDVEWFELKIYSPRKKLVFETRDPRERWYGKKGDNYVKSGQYIWTVKYKPRCPNTPVTQESGTVDVLIK